MFGDMDDLMRAFGGGDQLRGSGGRRRKGRDIGHALPVTLEDLYNGKTIEIPHEKSVLCATCNGRGTKKEGITGKCTACNGVGAKIVRRQMGPMIQQMQVPCEVCQGEGLKIDPKDRCPTCAGRRTKIVSSPLKVVIEKGMEHQQQIPFRGEGDQHPDVDPGDIVIVLQQQKHERFTRVGSDLLTSVPITLQQALCGFDVTIPHLDGRVLVVHQPAGQIIKPNDIKLIAGEGMPLSKRKGSCGDLVVEFSVVFPERLQDSQINLLSGVLPPPPRRPDIPADGEVVYVQRQSIDDVRHTVEEEDDDDERGGGVQCAQQ